MSSLSSPSYQQLGFYQQLHDRYLMIALSGDAEPQGVVEAYQQLVGIAMQSRQNRVLVDARRLNMVRGADSMIETNQKAGDLLSGLKVARVLDASSYGFHMLDTHAMHGDETVKNFATEADALTWLLYRPLH